MSQEYSFFEKQYFGRDYTFISIRLVLAFFCFIIYYWNDTKGNNSELLLLVGCGILLASFFMLFILLFRTKVKNKAILIDGLWTSRLVKIDLNSIVKVEKGIYSTFFINNPVYNLHRKGKIKFYAGGKDAIRLTDRDGLIYVIGTQKPTELYLAIQEEMKR